MDDLDLKTAGAFVGLDELLIPRKYMPKPRKHRCLCMGRLLVSRTAQRA